MPDTSRILTAEQAAVLAQVSAETIRRACRAGELRSGRCGQEYRISETAVRRWIFGDDQDNQP